MKGSGGNADRTAKWPVKIDYQYHDERQRGREYAGHRHVHGEVVVAKEICVAGSDHSAQEYYPPDRARNMALNSREAATTHQVKLVPAIQQLGLYHRFTKVLGLDSGDSSIEISERLPSLVRRFAGALGRPFLVDDNANVARCRITDRLPLGPWQSLGIEVDPAGVVGFALHNIGRSAECFPRGDSDEGEENRVQYADNSDRKAGKVIMGLAYVDMHQSMEDKQPAAGQRGRERDQDGSP